MKIFNEVKMQEIRAALGFEHLSYDEMCERVFDSTINREDKDFFRKNFTFIGEGSDRVAYSLDKIEAVVKVDFNIENYENEVSLQGAIEKRVYEKFKDYDSCYEIYGFSDNCGVIFCQELESCLTDVTILDYGLTDLYCYIKNIFYRYEDTEDEMESDCFYEYLENNIVDYLEDVYEELPFDDIHIDNIGIDKQEGTLKVLDLGYGDYDSAAEEVLEDLLIKSDKIIRGARNFNSCRISNLINRYGGYRNEIIA